MTTSELLDLRRRLLGYVRAQFGGVLGAELEDVVQHAFVVLFRRRARLRPENDGLYRYLQAAARHAALDRIKAIKVRQKQVPPTLSEPARRMATDAAGGLLPEGVPDEAEKIWKIFRALDDLDRLILWNHVVEGKSIRAIAREVDLNWHRVAGIIERTLRDVRRELT